MKPVTAMMRRSKRIGSAKRAPVWWKGERAAAELHRGAGTPTAHGSVDVLRVRPLPRGRVMARREAAFCEEAANQRWYRVNYALCPKGQGAFSMDSITQTERLRRRGTRFVFYAAEDPPTNRPRKCRKPHHQGVCLLGELPVDLPDEIAGDVCTESEGLTGIVPRMGGRPALTVRRDRFIFRKGDPHIKQRWLDG